MTKEEMINDWFERIGNDWFYNPDCMTEEDAEEWAEEEGHSVYEMSNEHYRDVQRFIENNTNENPTDDEIFNALSQLYTLD